MKILFISGLPRSGTTFLQAELLRHNNVVALGEVFQTVRAIQSKQVEISLIKRVLFSQKRRYWNQKSFSIILERAMNDSFWSSLIPRIQSFETVKEAVLFVYQQASLVYPGHLLVDSSKQLSYLKIATEICIENNFNFKVIFCLRDFRGWISSMNKHKKRVGYKILPRIIDVVQWKYSNKGFLRFLENSTYMEYILISYDSYVLRYSFSLNKLQNFAGLTSDDFNSLYYLDKFHEMFGSQTLKSKVENGKIVYDFSWFKTSIYWFDFWAHSFNKMGYEKHNN